MLTTDEREIVREELSYLLLQSADPRAQLITIFTPDETPVLKEIDIGPHSARDYAVHVVRYCLQDRWNRHPSMLERLLSELVNQGNANIVPLRDRVKTGVDPNLDPINSSWVTAEQPFFGRIETRKIVKRLVDCSDKPILLVQGAEKSGKTYTGHWLDYLADESRCGFRIVVESLEKKSGPSMSPDLLAESLVAKMGRPIDKMPPSTPHRYEKRLCNWIISEALQSPGRTWIVLDGFDDPDLDRGTAALIQELAANLLVGELNRKVRLILIDFRSKLARVDLPRIEFDQVPKPEEVLAHELDDCLKQHFADIHQAVEDSFINALAGKLVADAEKLRADPEYQTEAKLKLLNLVVYNFRQQDLKRIGRIA